MSNRARGLLIGGEGDLRRFGGLRPRKCNQRHQSASESRAYIMGEIFDLNNSGRSSYIGGSDARTVMGHDEAALIRLWQEKRGDIEAEDLATEFAVDDHLARANGPG